VAVSEPATGVCLCLTGPTASGKTDLALSLAERLPIEIVSMDSALVYRGMDIGTAKPSPAVRARVPHHLIDIVDPADPYSAGRFARDARAVIQGIQARGRAALLVGGTLLYLRAFRDGLASLPSASIEVRSQLDREAQSRGWPALHRRLADIDPEAARKISPSDRQRIQRALEVYELTGESITSHRRRSASARVATPVRVLAIVDDDRAALAARIERRFDAMVEAGFIAEVERLMRRGDLNSELPALRAVGYRQIWRHLAGELEWRDARARAISATRQLAKRQMTWLRSETNLEIVRWSDVRLLDSALAWIGSTQAAEKRGTP